MATKKPNTIANGQANNAAPARSAIEAKKGVYNSLHFANVMSALMSDVLAGRVMPSVANAACNAGGKLLKAAEMQIKYANGKEILQLTEERKK